MSDDKPKNEPEIVADADLDKAVGGVNRPPVPKNTLPKGGPLDPGTGGGGPAPGPDTDPGNPKTPTPPSNPFPGGPA